MLEVYSFRIQARASVSVIDSTQVFPSHFCFSSVLSTLLAKLITSRIQKHGQDSPLLSVVVQELEGGRKEASLAAWGWGDRVAVQQPSISAVIQCRGGAYNGLFMQACAGWQPFSPALCQSAHPPSLVFWFRRYISLMMSLVTAWRIGHWNRSLGRGGGWAYMQISI